jgi:hypothetical protein
MLFVGLGGLVDARAYVCNAACIVDYIALFHLKYMN